MRIPTAVRWTCLALLGILIAAAVSVAASRLASQQIGLASEPISAGDALAPAVRQQRATAPKHGPVKPTKHPQPGTVPSVPAQPTEPAPAQPTELAPAPTPPVEAPEPSHPGGDGERGEGGADD